MRALFSLLSVSFFALFYFVGCTENTFSVNPSQACLDFNYQYGDGSCTFDESGITTFSYTMTTGTVDLLFITDNSSSMYDEQSAMASKFPGFIDSIAGLDFHIAMITTDISEDKYLKFPNGKDYLSSSEDSLSTIKSEFINTVKRPETLSCDTSGTGCASNDERGIYTLNQAFNRGHQNFYRSSAHLAVVILSDEDERSNGGNFANYPLDPNTDTPSSLVSNIKTQLGADKVMSFHSVIVRPNDSRCFDAQKDDVKRTSGFYGTQYQALSYPNADLLKTKSIVKGVTGSICSNNYGTALGNIADQLKGIDFIQLPCDPLGGEFKATDEKTGAELNFTLDGNRVTFFPAISAGVEIRPQYKCPKML